MIYVIRHGEVDANKDGIIITRTDHKLNETGKKQALELKKILQEITYDCIYCSPLTRTKETANIINVLNKEIIYDNRLIERDCGILEGTKYDSSIFDYYCNYNLNKKIQNGETMHELFERVYQFMDELKAKARDKNILIITHLGVCRTIACYFNGIPKDGDITIYPHHNCQIIQYEFENTK